MVRVLLAFSLLLITPSIQAEPTAEEILNLSDDLYRGASSSGTMTMTVVNEHWQRSLTLAFWSEGTKKSLVRILNPKKEKGTTTLRVQRDVWNYLPKVKRVIKVPGSMMGASWMGSHFTNNDLVRQNRMADDFTATVTFKGKRGDENIYEVTCIPRDDRPIVWGKIIVEARQADALPLKILYFDEDGLLARTLAFSDLQEISKRWVPMKLRITPEDDTGYTQVTYQQLHYDVSHPADLFTLRSLKR